MLTSNGHKEVCKDMKSSSTSAIYLTSTISSPNVKHTIKAVATILHSQLIEDRELGKKISPNSDLYCFSEDKYINDFPCYFDEQRIEYITKVPELEEISEFIEVSSK